MGCRREAQRYQVVSQLRPNDHLAEEVGPRLGPSEVLLRLLSRQAKFHGHRTGTSHPHPARKSLKRRQHLPVGSGARGRSGELDQAHGAHPPRRSTTRYARETADHATWQSGRSEHRAWPDPAAASAIDRLSHDLESAGDSTRRIGTWRCAGAVSDAGRVKHRDGWRRWVSSPAYGFIDIHLTTGKVIKASLVRAFWSVTANVLVIIPAARWGSSGRLSPACADGRAWRMTRHSRASGRHDYVRW